MDLPSHFESARLTLRCYQPGDGKWYYAMSLKNRDHLLRFESENIAVKILSEEAAETLMGELADEWAKGNCYFIGAFEKNTGEFAVQVYVGTVNRKLPEYEIGCFADVDRRAGIRYRGRKGCSAGYF
jgi:hypothetical protein